MVRASNWYIKDRRIRWNADPPVFDVFRSKDQNIFNYQIVILYRISRDVFVLHLSRYQAI